MSLDTTPLHFSYERLLLLTLLSSFFPALELTLPPLLRRLERLNVGLLPLYLFNLQRCGRLEKGVVQQHTDVRSDHWVENVEQ